PTHLGVSDAPSVFTEIKGHYRVVKEVDGVALYQKIGT
ncbi:MAG: hypothetical protein QOJ44_1553, partial [Acidimicrobiaceae bacterium]|nr:hypothetical protein [Acidimicrobiaceae bacterium]